MSGDDNSRMRISTSIPVDEDTPVSAVHQRRHARVDYWLPVTLYGPTSFCHGMVDNLSAGGMFVRTRRPLSVDTELEFDLVLPTATLKLRGLVHWIRDQSSALPSGMGIGFTGVPEATTELLARALSQQTPDTQ